MKKLLTILLTILPILAYAQPDIAKREIKVDTLRARVTNLWIDGQTIFDHPIKINTDTAATIKALRDSVNVLKDSINDLRVAIQSGGVTISDGWMKWATNVYRPYLSATEAGGYFGNSGKLFVPHNSIYWDYFVRDSLYDNESIVYQGEFWAQRFLGYGANLLEATIGEQSISGNYIDLKKTGIELNVYSNVDAIQQPHPTTITPFYDETDFERLQFGNNGNNITMSFRSGNIWLNVPGLIYSNRIFNGGVQIEDTSLSVYDHLSGIMYLRPHRILMQESGTTADLNNGNLTLSGDFTYNVRHGLMHISGATYTPDVTQNIPFKLTPGMTNFETPVGMTLAGDTAICVTPGAYNFNIGITFSGGNGVDWEIAAFVNSVQYTDYFTVTTSGATNFVSSSWFWYIDLVANDKVSFKIINKSDNSDPTIKNMKIDYIKLHN